MTDTTTSAVQANDVRTPMRRITKPDTLVELTEAEAEREYQGEPVDALEELLAYSRRLGSSRTLLAQNILS